MVFVKILKRRDGSSVVVAVVTALIIVNFLGSVTQYLAGKLANLHSGQYGSAFPGTGWRGEYLYPFLQAVFSLILLEILCWIYVWAKPRGSR